MFDNSFALLFLSWVGAVAGWTYTDYLTTTTLHFLSGESTVTSTYYMKVYPTDSVRPTSTNITTALISDRGEQGKTTYPITITQLFLSPTDISCSSDLGLGCSPSETATPTTTIDTSYYAPLVVSAPSSCTETSFLYTTPHPVLATGIGSSHDTNLADQATQSSEALFVTTYLYTLSTNLGGQAVTTTRCDVYLNDEAVLGLRPGEEAFYLDQCVDPRRYLCTSTTTVDSGACEVTGGAYPPDGKTGGVEGTGTGTSPTASPTGGVGGLGALSSQGMCLLALPMSILVLSLL